LESKLGFDNSFMVDSKGHSEGLILLWQSEWQVSIQNYSRRHINVVINMGSSGIPCKFMGFYGHPVAAKRHKAWSLLRCLASMSPITWLCLGDFNKITLGAETSSIAVRPQKQMRDFQMVLEDCHLSDLGFRGPLFTWSNGRTLERLDRAMANSDWCLLFNVVEVSILSQCFSDHNPILVSFSHNREVRWNKSRSFHYEASWTKHPDHHDMVKEVWRVKDSSRG
jgi:hypothetical protein